MTALRALVPALIYINSMALLEEKTGHGSQATSNSTWTFVQDLATRAFRLPMIFDSFFCPCDAQMPTLSRRSSLAISRSFDQKEHHVGLYESTNGLYFKDEASTIKICSMSRPPRCSWSKRSLLWSFRATIMISVGLFEGCTSAAIEFDVQAKSNTLLRALEAGARKS
jgi:hypothetical protein